MARSLRRQARCSKRERASQGANERRSVGPRLLGTLTGLATAVALMTSAISLLFTLNPALRPQGPPEKLGGTITKVALAEGVKYYRYRNDVYGSLDPKNDKDLREHFDQVGTMVFARVELQGFRERTYSVTPVLYNAATTQPYEPSGPARVDRLYSVSQALTPSASTDALTFRCWIGADLPTGRYFVRVGLFDDGLSTSITSGP
jgi:hypothetical protein